MHTITTRLTGVSAGQLAEALRRGLGPGCQAEPDGGSEVTLRRGPLQRARVSIRSEPDGTTFQVRGQGIPFPLLYFTLSFINDRGLAREAAQVLGRPDVFFG
jgi:hypothetical protein